MCNRLSKRIGLVLLIVFAGILLLSQSALADPHAGQSVNIVIIGGTVLDTGACNGYGSEANNMGTTWGGCLPVTGSAGELGDFNFTPMAPSAVSAASLTPFDTAVLNVASTAMACNTNTLSSQQKADLISFVANGKKLIIFDSECWPQDYSWLPFPFTTANPGAMGAPGTLTIVEENTLSSNNSVDPHYINAPWLSLYTDAVGDMNVMTTYDPNWCIDMSGTNYLQVTGPVHTYAKYPSGTDVGLIIYNGLDQNYQGYGLNDPWLRKVWVFELQQPFNPSNLPCGYTVVGITLTPASAENNVGEDHTVTATLSDLLGNPQPGITVDFSVISGPNNGTSGTCSANTDCTSDSNGQVSFTYAGDGGVGIDEIKACFFDQGGNYICSQTVTKEWLNTPPVANPNGPYSGDEGSAILLDGTGSSDPDGDPLSYSWSVDSPLCSFDDATSATPNLTCTDNGDFTVTLVVDDGQATDSDTAAVTVYNVAPTVSIDSVSPTLVAVEQPVTAAGTFTDPGTNDTHTAIWDWGDTTTSAGAVSGLSVGPDSHTYTSAGIYTIELTVTDDDGGAGTAVYQFVVVYDPSAGFVTGGGWIDSPYGALRLPTDLPFFGGSYYELVEVPYMAWTDANTAANAAILEGCEYPHLVTITSQDEQDALYGFFDGALQGKWYGGFQNEGETDPAAGWNWVTGEVWDYTNWAPGEPNDAYGSGSEPHLIGWLDGWAWNDEGNLGNVTGYVIEYEKCGPIGKANFGFVSKYQKGASVPTGNTEFQFHAASLNFHSNSYEWLVVTGSNYARYKGVGTINGEGAYKFMLWAGDGTGTGGADTFRIKIWEEDEFGDETVIYDNGMDQDIAGGSIVVHTKK